MSMVASKTWNSEQPIYRGTGGTEAIKGASTIAINKLAAARTVEETGKLRGERTRFADKVIARRTIHSLLARRKICREEAIFCHRSLSNLTFVSSLIYTLFLYFL
jgi:hypothetical protein